MAVLPLAREWIEMQKVNEDLRNIHVLPLAREWIEMLNGNLASYERAVLPLAREWIEIINNIILTMLFPLFSLLRGSGLKL